MPPRPCFANRAETGGIADGRPIQANGFLSDCGEASTAVRFAHVDAALLDCRAEEAGHRMNQGAGIALFSLRSSFFGVFSSHSQTWMTFQPSALSSRLLRASRARLASIFGPQ